jgi:starch synthase
MYSMAYGTIPVVRNTGGLADTVIDANSSTIDDTTATGFSFADYSVEALGQTLHRAVETYRNQRAVWNQMMINGMTTDWSWESSARKYESLYEKTIRWAQNESK